MKVLICTPEYHYQEQGGLGRITFDSSKMLEKNGVDIKICSPSGPDIILGKEKIITDYGGLGLLYYWYAVSNYFKNNATADVIWMHDPLFFGGIPFEKSVATMHSTYLGFYRTSKVLKRAIWMRVYYFIMQQIEKHCLLNLSKKDNLFVAVSPTIKKELETYGIPADRIVYIPNGVNFERFKPENKIELRKKWNLPKDKIVMMWVGRLIPEKSPERLITLFESLNQKLNDLYLVIAGDGELNKKISKMISEKNLKNINLMGYVPNERIHELYNCADIFITSSKYEGQPVTVLEAMASGLPVIAPNTPTFDYLVSDKNGLLIDSQFGEIAVEQIKHYLTNRKYISQSKNVRKCALKMFSINSLAENYLKLFQRPKNGH